jgi:nucleotide-binding universal stress UspA family protein
MNGRRSGTEGVGRPTGSFRQGAYFRPTMTLVVVPVRYPLSRHSRATLERAMEVAAEHDADLTVLHVNVYQGDERVTRRELKSAVEAAFGRLNRARYVVRPGFLVEETILDEVAAEDADYVVIGQKQAGRWRRMVRRLIDDPDIEGFLRRELDCEIITATS